MPKHPPPAAQVIDKHVRELIGISSEQHTGFLIVITALAATLVAQGHLDPEGFEVFLRRAEQRALRGTPSQGRTREIIEAVSEIVKTMPRAH